jgi:hypothetical protein
MPRRFLIKCVMFCLPLVAAAATLEYALHFVPTAYAATRHALDARSASAEVLVTGSSHEWSGVNVALLGRDAVNVAHVSQSLIIDGQLVAQYLDRLPHLKAVLIGVAYHSLFTTLDASPERWRWQFYYRNWGIRAEDVIVPTDVKSLSLVALYGPRLAVRRVLDRDGALGADWEATRGPSNHAAPVLDRQAGDRISYHHSLMTIDHVARNRAALDDLLRGLAARGIAAAFVTAPVSAEYRRRERSSYADLTDATLRSLSDVYAVPRCDFAGDPRFGDADFADADHLNARGAEIYSRILAGDVLRDLLQRRPLSCAAPVGTE